MIAEVLMKNYERESKMIDRKGLEEKPDDLDLSQMQFGSLFQKA